LRPSDAKMRPMTRRVVPDLGLEPLTARSLVLSALLGSHPPILAVRALVNLASLFDIAEGTLRTALSRMVVAEELEAQEGRYRLGERFRRRQEAQDVALRAPREPWDGQWRFAIVDAPRRSVAERRAFRGVMEDHRMGELRPDTWLRPANIPGPPSTEGVMTVVGKIEDRASEHVARQLWDLDAISNKSRSLRTLVDRALGWLEPRDPSVLADTFLVSVATVRFLRTEPQLPTSIVGEDWPPEALRAAYQRMERAHLSLMRSFLEGATSNSHAAE
jgi:phenylacetic acid degradation operon negative regulatory protein